MTKYANTMKIEQILSGIFQIAGDAPELNLNNYTEDQVEKLNDAMIEIYNLAKQAYDIRTEKKTSINYDVTASYFDKIQKGFKKLQEDCTEVSLIGFCQKDEIPDEAHREEFEEEFDHEYQLTKSDGYDEASFWGDIYLQLDGALYMRFDVIG